MKMFSPLLTAVLISVTNPFVVVLAADVPKDIGPEVVKIKMGGIYLNLKHWKHQESNNNECSPCHNSKDWKIEKWGEDVAHQICISCHDRIGKGPTDCTGCHTTDYTTKLEDD